MFWKRPIGSRRLEAQGAAGLKKRLPVLSTAHWRARDLGSVSAANRLLFCVHKTGFTAHMEFTRAIACEARGARCCGACS